MSVRIMVGEVRSRSNTFSDGSKDSAGDLLVGIYEAEDRINGYGSIAN